ncbi:hypothetical protein T08_8906, partial [Trichinella sp. T8]
MHKTSKIADKNFLALATDDISELRLVPYCRGNMSLVYEGRACKLKHVDKQKKYLRRSNLCAECTACIP